MCVHLVLFNLNTPSFPLSLSRDPNNRLPVLRVLVVRVTGALMLQVGVVVPGGGVGVVAVLVDLIQTPDGSNRKYDIVRN